MFSKILTAFVLSILSIAAAHAGSRGSDSAKGPFFARECGKRLQMLSTSTEEDPTRFGVSGMRLPSRFSAIRFSPLGKDLAFAIEDYSYEKHETTITVYNYTEKKFVRSFAIKRKTDENDEADDRLPGFQGLIAYKADPEDRAENDLFWGFFENDKGQREIRKFNVSKETLQTIQFNRKFSTLKAAHSSQRDRLYFLGVSAENKLEFFVFDLNTGKRLKFGMVKGVDVGRVDGIAVDDRSGLLYALVISGLERKLVRVRVNGVAAGKVTGEVALPEIGGVRAASLSDAKDVLYVAGGVGGIFAIDLTRAFEPKENQNGSVYSPVANRYIAPHSAETVFALPRALLVLDGVDTEDNRPQVLGEIPLKRLHGPATKQDARNVKIRDLVYRWRDLLEAHIEGGVWWDRFAPELKGKDHFEFLTTMVYESANDEAGESIAFWKDIPNLKPLASPNVPHDAATFKNSAVTRAFVEKHIKSYFSAEALAEMHELPMKEAKKRAQAVLTESMEIFNALAELGLSFGYRTDMYGGCGDSGMLLLISDIESGYIYGVDINPSS